MQLAPQVLDEAVLSRYTGGEITLVNSTNGPSSLVRGELLGAQINGEWVSVRMTCREYASGTIDSIESAIWSQSSNEPTHALLYSAIEVIDDTLRFIEPTPNGSTAIVRLP